MGECRISVDECSLIVDELKDKKSSERVNNQNSDDQYTQLGLLQKHITKTFSFRRS